VTILPSGPGWAIQNDWNGTRLIAPDGRTFDQMTQTQQQAGQVAEQPTASNAQASPPQAPLPQTVICECYCPGSPNSAGGAQLPAENTAGQSQEQAERPPPEPDVFLDERQPETREGSAKSPPRD
jgi:hypothetical protein